MGTVCARLQIHGQAVLHTHTQSNEKKKKKGLNVNELCQHDWGAFNQYSGIIGISSACWYLRTGFDRSIHQEKGVRISNTISDGSTAVLRRERSFK